MKKNILKLFVLSSLLFLGITTARAQTFGTASTSNFYPTTLTASGTGQGVFGFSYISGTTGYNLGDVDFSTSISPTFFSNYVLYESITNSLGAAEMTAPIASSANGDFTQVSATDSKAKFEANVNTSANTTYYFFLVADFTLPAASTSITINLASVTRANGTVITGTATPITYTITVPPVTLGTATTAGLAAPGSLNSVSQTSQGILGFSVSTTVSTTINAITLTPTVSAGNMGSYFTNVKLFVNTTNSFTTATAVPAGYIVGPLTGATVSITGLMQAINTTTKYYFIEADYIPPTSGNPTFQLSATSVTTSTSTVVTTGGPIAGTVYTLYNGVTTATALGVTGGPLAGLMTNPLVNPQVGAVYGMSLANSGTAVSPTITVLNFTSNAPQFDSYYMANFTLYSSPTNSFSAGTAMQVGSTVTAGNSNTLSFTGLGISIPAGGTQYYFVSVTYNGVAANSTYQLNFASATTALSTTSVAANAGNTGFNYTCMAPSYSITTNTLGIPANNSNYYYGSTGDVLESFGVTATSTATFSGFTINTYINGATGGAYTSYFNNLTIYTSSNPNYAADLAGTGSPLTSVPFTTTGTGTLAITLNNSQALGATPIYYFIVADFTNGDNLFTNTTTATTFQFRLTAASVNATAATTFPIAYNIYKLLSPIAFGNSTSNNTAGVSLNTTQTQVSLIGFSLTAAAGASPETVNTISFSANIVPVTTEIGGFFSNVTLYYNTTDNPATAIAVPPGSPAYSVSSLNGKTFTISGLSLNVTATTLYYYVKADFTAPTNFSSTFQLSATGCTTTTPLTCTAGIPVAGTLYNISPSVIIGAATTTGLVSNPITANNDGNIVAIFSFSINAGPATTFTTFNLYSTQPAGQYLGTDFSNYQLLVNTTNSLTGATAVTGDMFSAINNSTTLTISGLTQAIPAGKTYYYFIEAKYASPAVATTFELNLASVATASNTYTTGGPVYGPNYTCAGPLGVYYWVGNNNVWENQNNWLNANTGFNNNGYPNQTLNTDIAVFSLKYVNFSYIAVVGSSKTLNQVILDINNKNPYTIELKNSNSFTVTNGVVLGDPGQVNTQPPPANPYLSQLQLAEYTTNGSGTYILSGTSTIYNDGSLIVSAPTSIPAGSIVNLYGTTNDPAFLGVFSGGTLTANSSTFNLSGNGSEVYVNFVGTAILNATNSTFNFGGFSAQLYNLNTTTLTGCTINAAGLSNNQYITGLGEGNGTMTIGGSSVVNLGTASNNGNYTLLSCKGGTLNITGSTVVNLLGPSSYIYSDYFKGMVTNGGSTITMPQATVNVNASTLNIGSSGGTDGSAANVTNTDAAVFNLNAQSIINLNGANSALYNNSSANNSGTTNGGVFIAASTSVINPISTTAIINNTPASNYFTLLSDANGSATIGQLGVGAKITGQFNVQRYISAASRNYRLLSSATNSTSYMPGSTGTANHVNVSLVAQSATIPTSPVVTYPGAFVGGPAGTGAGFTGTSVGPTMYLYQESIVPSLTNYNSSFYSGKNVGITKLGTNSPYYLTTSSTANAAGGTGAIAADNAANIVVGPGNGYLLYYIHDNTSTNTEGPLNTTSTTASGYVNQGTIPFVLWGSNGSLTSSLTNNGISPLINPHAFAGLTMVGNPYPSSIDLQQLYKDNLGGSAVFLSGAIEYFSELNPSNAQFVTYGYDGANVYNTGNSASRYVASGQGFYVTVQNANQGLTFYEDEKTTSAPSNVTESIPVINPNIVNNVNTGNSKITDAILLPGAYAIVNDASLSTVTSKTIDVMSRSEVSSPGTTVTDLPAPKNTPPPSSGSVGAAVAVAGLHLKLVQDSLNYDECGLYFSKKFADIYNKRDATDMDGVGGQVYLSSYTSDRVRTSVNLLGDYKGGKRVPLFVKFSGNGIFQLQMEDIANFNTNNYSVFLIDNLKKDSLDLTLYKSYNFNYATGTPGDSTRFVLAIEHKPVPHYALLAFAGQKVTQGVQLNWKTLNEANTTSFVLQKLNSGNTYTFLDSLHSDSAGAYAYVDQHPVLGDNTYRLQQTDALGNITYSAPVTIGYNSTSPNGGLTIYPNPAKSTITVTLSTSSIASQIATADIYNTSGTLISHRVVTSNSFNHDISNYQLGVYIIELRNSNGILVGKSKFVKVQ